MEKSADFIRKKEFHIVFKGYKPEEVDKFLDILSVEFDRLLKRNRELQDSLDKLKFENTEEDTDIKKVIQDALISAHKVAEDIKAQAKKEADSIIDQRKAVEDRSLHDLQMKKLQMEESLLVLQGKYDDFKNRIKKTILDMTQFIDEAATDLDSNDYAETDFAGVKYDDGEDKDQDMSDEPEQKTSEDETPAETDEKQETLLKVKQN
jgi:cell division initiation protein